MSAWETCYSFVKTVTKLGKGEVHFVSVEKTKLFVVNVGEVLCVLAVVKRDYARIVTVKIFVSMVDNDTNAKTVQMRREYASTDEISTRVVTVAQRAGCFLLPRKTKASLQTVPRIKHLSSRRTEAPMPTLHTRVPLLL